MSTTSADKSPPPPTTPRGSGTYATRLSTDSALYRVSSERPSEELHGLLRNVSIDTTCASPDPTNRRSTSVPPAAVESLRRSQASASFSKDEEPSEAQWTATIVASFDLCGAVRYILQVRQPPRKWLIRRRYTDFVELHEALRRRFGEPGLPSVPPKSHSIFGPSAEFLDNRQKQLQRYIDTIAASRAPLRNCRLLVRFLAPPRPEDRCTFLSSDVPPLPTDLPDLPVAEEWPSDVPEDTKREVEQVVADGVAALRQLYLFDQELATDSSAERQSICFDQARSSVARAVATLAEFAPRLTALCVGPEALPALRSWKAMAPFVGECCRVAGLAVAWGSAFHAEEALVIRRVLGDTSALVRPLSYYERRTDTVRQEWAAACGDGSSWAPPPPSVEELLDQIRGEMALRSTAQQAASVHALRKLYNRLKDCRSLVTAERMLHAPPASSVVAALEHRMADARTLLDNLLGDADDSGLDLTGVQCIVCQLASDIRATHDALEDHVIEEPGPAAATQDVVARLTVLDQQIAQLQQALAAPGSVELPPLSA